MGDIEPKVLTKTVQTEKIKQDFLGIIMIMIIMKKIRSGT